MIDVAGPFRTRSLALLETAIEVGAHVIDLNDDLSYAERTLALEPKIAEAKIRVVPSASSVSTLAAEVIRRVGI